MKQNKKLSIKTNHKRSRGKALLVGFGLSGLIFLLCAISILVIVPALSPSTGAETADVLRSIIGPAPVAVLETVSFDLQDQLHQLQSNFDGGKKDITFSQASSLVMPTASPIPTKIENQIPAMATPTLIPPTPMMNVVTESPQIGWQAYGPEVNGEPVMARALIMLDPQRSYTAVALIRMDLSQLKLHLMAGTIEPSHPSGISQAIPSLGVIPADEQNVLVAAFNGGFKGEHGNYGMMVNGFTLLPPQNGLGTIAFYKDGHIQMGTWGTNMIPPLDIISLRQNCPPLIEDGQINPALYLDNRKAWGYTGNSDITWRTGLGLTQDGKYLIYAVGNGTPASILAEALQKAGAYNAMQLDIHQFFAHFYTYQADTSSSGFQMAGQRLVDQMVDNPHLYLTPSLRDFFYVTLR